MTNFSYEFSFENKLRNNFNYHETSKAKPAAVSPFTVVNPEQEDINSNRVREQLREKCRKIAHAKNLR